MRIFHSGEIRNKLLILVKLLRFWHKTNKTKENVNVTQHYKPYKTRLTETD